MEKFCYFMCFLYAHYSALVCNCGYTHTGCFGIVLLTDARKDQQTIFDTCGVLVLGNVFLEQCSNYMYMKFKKDAAQF